jgi:acyl transferase domain-containing protein
MTDKSIAIVGMAGRFPGAASVDELWTRLVDGEELLTRFTPEQLDAARVSRSVYTDPNYVPVRGVLPDADLFDARFFGYSPREAELTDPQQRVLLECAWEAFENAGIACDGIRAGVFAGSSVSTYLLRHVVARPDLEQRLGFLPLIVGNDKDFLATRIAYKLNLRGPAVSVQTACSTSLVAVHMACQSLLRGESDVALAGGVRIFLPQEVGYVYEAGGIASPNGQCRAFDRGAQGTVTGSGAALVVLRQTADAVRDGNTIYAVIRGSAINNDGGGKVGYTAPSIDGQAAAIRSALCDAGVSADTIGYVEAHGTATELGDRIEMAALTQAYGADTERRQYCALGSVKSNIGHLDAAAGVVGLIKATMSLWHGVIPPSINCALPNPDIPFAESPFFVNQTAREWPRSSTPRRCGVSSFGIGGTNVHVVLEEGPLPGPRTSDVGAAEPYLLTLSAAEPKALAAMAGRLAARLQATPPLDLADVEHTLRNGRAEMPARLAVAGSDREELSRRLAIRRGGATARSRATAFLFPGLGAQRGGAVRDVYRGFPRFRAALDECAQRLRPRLGVDVQDLVCGAASETADDALRGTRLGLPALFAVEYAMAGQLDAWGVKPAMLLGYSLGEYAAACVSGAMSLPDALDLVCVRGELMDGAEPGGMLAVSAPRDEVEAALIDDASVAGANAPALTIVAGTVAAIEQLTDQFTAAGITTRRLALSHGYHSRMMEPFADEFEQFAARIAYQPLQIPIISNLTGEVLPRGFVYTAGYWRAHLCQPVLFQPGMARLAEIPHALCVEIGPGTSLVTLVAQNAGDALHTVPTMPGSGPGVAQLLEAAGDLWAHGAQIDLAEVTRRRGRSIGLPTYPFDRRRHWLEPGRLRGDASQAGPSRPAVLPAVTAEVPGAGDAHEQVVRELGRLWCELLGTDDVRPDSNFFALGGHSLLAVRLLTRVRRTFGVAMELRTVLDAPTLGAMADVIGGVASAGPKRAWGELR